MRLFAAVVTGYLIFAIASVLIFQLSGNDPRMVPSLQFGVASVLLGCGFAALGGYMANLLSRRPSETASLWVAGLIGGLALTSLISDWHAGSHWSQYAAVFWMCPSAFFGGRLFIRRKRD